MKKARFLALTSLCSVLAGMPAKALEIKDSGAKKIGGVETQVDKESNSTNKNEVKGKFDLDYVKRFIKDPEFIEYAKWASVSLAIWGFHEWLAYRKGKPGQFYEKLAWLSVTGQVRKRKKLELKEKLEKDEKSEEPEDQKAKKELEIKRKEEEKRKKHKDNMDQLLAQQQDLENREDLKSIFQKIRKLGSKVLMNILLENKIYDKDQLDYCKRLSGSLISSMGRICGQNLEILQRELEKNGVSKEEFEKISYYAKFYNFYFSHKKHHGFMFTFFPKNCDTSEFYDVKDAKELAYFSKKFALITVSSKIK